VTTGKLLIAITIVTGYLSACAQSEFAGDSGQGIRTKKPPVGPPATDVPGPTDTPGNNELIVDDSGEIKLVDAELIVSRSTDGAAWKNCLYAGIQGQPDVELGCNRASPGGNRLPPGRANIKLKTNECNQLRLALYTQRPGEGAPTPNLSTVGTISRFQIQKLEPRKFKINANDNFDNDWNDLNVTIYTTNPKIKFTIQGSGIPCD
jgi:hypothetical protein